MPYLLDGNNLIGLIRRTSKPTDEDRQALVAELSDRLRKSRARAVLFFDGAGGGRGATLGSLSVREASGSSADDAIVGTVESSRTPAECIVVTGDRGLASRVRAAGGKVSSPADFFARFGQNAGAGEARPETGRVDVEDWMRWFGDDRNRE